VEITGVGFLTGALVRLRLLPAPPDAGLMFVRTDQTPPFQIPARIEKVSATQRRTVLGQPPHHVGLVEHVLAALAGLRIDNCLLELNAPEPPGLDGSALGFVQAIHQAGTVLQAARRAVWSVDSPIFVEHQGATLTLHPAWTDELKISYLLEYGPDSPIGSQVHTQTITPDTFANELADCRTFVLEEEVAELRRQGLGTRTTTSDLLVFGRHGPINNTLRHANEPARHKVLDMVGDLALFGHDLCGHLVAYRSGHALNAELVRILARRLAQSEQPRCAAA
jgi:UDP-3-O-acyl N-acetylglucosamine deacetylase